MNLNFSSRCMMMGRMTARKGGIKASREEEDNLQDSIRYRHTHSRCGHGDPRDDHLGDAFDCCFLQDGDPTGRSQLINIF